MSKKYAVFYSVFFGAVMLLTAILFLVLPKKSFSELEKRKMCIRDRTSVIIYAIQILSSLMMVSFVFVLIMIAGASADRIEEVLDEIPELRDQPDACLLYTSRCV